MNFVFTIAGSDSSAGAGIQEDLKTCSALGVYCVTVITSITAQNTFSVRDIFDLPAETVEKQLEAVYEDFPLEYGKTGMVSNKNIIEKISNKIIEHGLKVVVDPVMYSKSGSKLLKDDSIDSIKSNLIPIAYIVTPNIPEAEILSNIKISGLEDMKLAAERIRDLGPKIVIVKGGHMESETVVDVIYDGKFKYLEYPKIRTRNTHGTGCTYSSAIASFLAKGDEPFEAIENARSFLQESIKNSLNIGHGNGPLNPFFNLWNK
ncbi:MAG: bifunctional hydroxymethylpyrimidine kinase/phosphomethylpyrimidine kinase [Thermoplasmata archaeon]